MNRAWSPYSQKKDEDLTAKKFRYFIVKTAQIDSNKKFENCI